MTERILMNNAWHARYFIGAFVGTSLMCNRWGGMYMMNWEVFGHDGNGGSMLKIVTNLTDEEMARLKYVRRIYWHWKGSRRW